MPHATSKTLVFFNVRCKWHNLSSKRIMKQLNVPAEMKVDVDYSDKQIPESAKIFTPLVFKDGDSFCVVLGPDPQAINISRRYKL